jgi:hypothetical protein
MGARYSAIKAIGVPRDRPYRAEEGNPIKLD